MMRFLGRLSLFLGLLIFGVPAMVFLELPWPGRLATRDPASTSFMRYREREARAQGEELTIQREWTPLGDVPRDLVRAVLVSEDDRFREHHGVDWKSLAQEVHWSGGETFSWSSAADRSALEEAFAYAWDHRDEMKGRSTITQQLAKNLYFTPERSLWRKAEELIVTRRLERSLTKDRILELYLNTVELGPGVFGVGAAARHYFGVPVKDLGRFQAASLAATLPQPLTSNPAYKPARMAWRRDLILERLAGRNVVIPVEPPSLDVALPSVGALEADTLAVDSLGSGGLRLDSSGVADSVAVGDTTGAGDALAERMDPDAPVP